MFRKSTLLAAATVVLLAGYPGFLIGAEGVSPAEAKLRESLRAALLQARTAEAARATSEAALAEKDEKIQSLTDKIAAMEKQQADEKAKSDQEIQELHKKVDTLQADIGTLKKSLDSWKVDHQKITSIAQALDTKRAKLEADNIILKRRVAEQQTKNEGMFAIGNEVLARYEKFGLGDALTAREPFVGITRVKFQSLMQDYADKLEDQRIKPPESKGSASKTKPEKVQGPAEKPKP